MPKKKSSARNPWTKDDIRQLKAHSKARTPVVEVAKAMKRTEAAVRQKAKTIAIGLGSSLRTLTLIGSPEGSLTRSWIATCAPRFKERDSEHVGRGWRTDDRRHIFL
jgi:hypothetical protein